MTLSKPRMRQFVESKGFLKFCALTARVGLAVRESHDILDFIVSEGMGQFFKGHVIITAFFNCVTTAVANTLFGAPQTA